MNQIEIEALMQGIVPALQAHVTKAVEPLLARIKELEARETDLASVAALVPAPKDGPTVEQILDALKPIVDEALAAIPPPKDGRDGPTAAEVAALIPAPKDGRDAPTLDEVLAAIPMPKDGTSVSLDDVKGLLAAHMASWALDFERRAQDVLQRAIDRMPAAKDGKDALPLTEFDFTVNEDARTITVSVGSGDGAKSVQRKVGWLLDRGVYVSGKSYDRGDAVSWGGHVWFAQVDGTKAMPAEGEPDWRLAVRKGRDGKNGIDRSAEGRPVKLP